MSFQVDPLRLSFSSDPRLLAVSRGVLQVWMEILGLEADRRSEVVLAVDEACANAMRHAYQGERCGIVDMQLALDQEWIEITVSDEGVPCPSECAEFKPLHRPAADEVAPGGLGVKLIHRVFDEVRFCPGDAKGNCVTMRLRRKEEGRDASDDRD